MSCFKFLVQNFVDSSVVANKYISSANSSYPESNLYDTARRTKFWRSSGYWDLSAGTPSIVFRETVGIDLTATLAASVYTSDSAFLTAIKTALDAAGASTYTVSRDSTTNKIKIASNGSGGGGVFQLVFSTSTFMAGILGYDTVDLTGALTYTADDLRIHTSEWVKWDFGMPSNPKAFVFTGDRNRALNFSPTAVLKLQGNQTDSWSSPSYEQTITYDEFTLFLSSDTGLHTEELRYWRFYVEDKDNTYGYVEGSLVYLGEEIGFDRGAPQFGFTAENIDRSTTVFSESGQEYTDIRPKAEQFNYSFEVMTKEDLELMQDIFAYYGTHTPFFISADKDAVYSSVKNRWCRYVKFASAPRYVLQSINNFSVQVQLREVL